MRETWRVIESHPNYSISNFGRVCSRARKKERILKPWPDPCGYLRVSLQRQTGIIAILVAQYFLPPKPTPKHELNHIDTDKTNNRADNLEWVTHLENMRHASANGCWKNPSHLGGRKLTEDQVREIRDLKQAGYSSDEVARRFKCGSRTVRHIWKGDTWRFI